MSFNDGDVKTIPGDPGMVQGNFNQQHFSDRKSRYKIFFGSFIISTAVALVFTWARPAVYQSKALLQVSYEQEQKGDSSPFELEELVVHQQRLNSRRMMSELASNLAKETDIRVNSDELLATLEARSVTDSRLLELHALGENPQHLVTYLNFWIKLYLSQFDVVKTEDNRAEIEGLEQRLSSIEDKIAAKRQQLDDFKSKHSIVSAEREENRSLAKIKALNQALDKALEQHAKAAAQLASVKTAIVAGKEVVRPRDQATIRKLKQDLVARQEEYQSKAEIYTPTYMAMDPDMRALKNKITVIEEKIASLQIRSRTLYLEDAQRELGVATEQKQTLEKELRDHRASAQVFSSNLDRFGSMKSELEKLQIGAQQLQSRLVNEQINQPHETKVTVLELPFVASQPIHPDYLQDSIYSVVGGFVYACLSLFIYGFLNPRYRPEIVLNAPIGSSQLPYTKERALPDAQPFRYSLVDHVEATSKFERNALTVGDCVQLLNAADCSIKVIISLLLSGISVDELLVLKRDALVESNGKYTLMLSDRSLVLAPRVSDSLRRYIKGTGEQEEYLLAREHEMKWDADRIDSLIVHVGSEASIDNPQQLSAELLEHTYRLFIINQGVALSELERYVGRMPDSLLQHYCAYQTLFSQGSDIIADPLYPALSG